MLSPGQRQETSYELTLDGELDRVLKDPELGGSLWYENLYQYPLLIGILFNHQATLEERVEALKQLAPYDEEKRLGTVPITLAINVLYHAHEPELKLAALELLQKLKPDETHLSQYALEQKVKEQLEDIFVVSALVSLAAPRLTDGAVEFPAFFYRESIGRRHNGTQSLYRRYQHSSRFDDPDDFVESLATEAKVAQHTVNSPALKEVLGELLTRLASGSCQNSWFEELKDGFRFVDEPYLSLLFEVFGKHNGSDSTGEPFQAVLEQREFFPDSVLTACILAATNNGHQLDRRYESALIALFLDDQRGEMCNSVLKGFGQGAARGDKTISVLSEFLRVSMALPSGPLTSTESVNLAALAIGRIGVRAYSAGPDLLKMLTSNDESQLVAAIKAISNIGYGVAEVEQHLSELILSSSSYSVVTAALSAVATLQLDTTQISNAICGRLERDTRFENGSLYDAIVAMPMHAEQLVPAVIKYESRHSIGIDQSLCYTLAHTKGDRVSKVNYLLDRMLTGNSQDEINLDVALALQKLDALSIEGTLAKVVKAMCAVNVYHAHRLDPMALRTGHFVIDPVEGKSTRGWWTLLQMIKAADADVVAKAQELFAADVRESVESASGFLCCGGLLAIGLLNSKSATGFFDTTSLLSEEKISDRHNLAAFIQLVEPDSVASLVEQALRNLEENASNGNSKDGLILSKIRFACNVLTGFGVVSPRAIEALATLAEGASPLSLDDKSPRELAAQAKIRLRNQLFSGGRKMARDL